MDPTVNFILQGMMALLMLAFGVILNGMRATIEKASANMDKVATDLKLLNDAVLGGYLTRAESDAKWAAQRDLGHADRNSLNETISQLRLRLEAAVVDVATLKGAREAPR